MGYYDSIASGYDNLHGEEQRKKLAKVKAFFSLQPTDKVLDVGCGTGLSSDFENFTVGIDPSFELLRHNKGMAVQGNAEFLPFKDTAFDAVICLTAVHHFVLKKALLEMKRVAKKHFAISLLKKSTHFQVLQQKILDVLPSARQIDAGQDVLFVV